ncbi:hypothetical protein TrVE_jg1183 [Triparma verrucosa]|uniref:Clp R domain-containing protein n=1 Tax=Triparma verrucosa TaxID=1606542 RepID=A0A9W7BXD9_9STRA|nr:hypothetical protein TrVE_jg1183 [Triparma verrucosa]
MMKITKTFDGEITSFTDDNYFNDELYTDSAWSCIQGLPKSADKFRAQSVDSAMLLDTILNEYYDSSDSDANPARASTNIAETILSNANVDVPRVRNELRQFLDGLPKVSDTSNKVMSPSLQKTLKAAADYMKKNKDDFVSTEAFIAALVDKDDFTKKALKRQNVDQSAVMEAIAEQREANGPVTSKNQEQNYDALAKYSVDFTQKAREGKLDPVIGRDSEVRRAIQVLSRRSKNNPILLGEPGVGKTAIAEGIAQRMVNGDVPDSLKRCKLVGLDMGALIAGAKFRGEFEERLKSVLKDVEKSDGEIVLFIDEVHTVVGAGATSGSMDASNLLKPALARGQLRCIGATTLSEYKQYVEKDKALERRFQKVLIEEPTAEDAVSILRGLKPRYEMHHGVRITDDALLAAAKLSDRYIQDRFLPDKAIDLVDEACAKLKNELTSKPTVLDEIDRRVIQLQMEKLSLESDSEGGGRGGGGRMAGIEAELEDLLVKQQNLEAQWMSERNRVGDVNQLREEIDALNVEIAEAERTYDLNTAAELKYNKLPALEEKLKSQEEKLSGGNDQDGSNDLLRDEVTADDIAAIVSSSTGIPVSSLLTSERDRLLQMDAILGERVIGQNDAVMAVTEAIQRSRAGLSDPSKPIASLIFLGPTGVGKTELCKALSEFMFDSEDAMIRFDMSEYMEKQSVSRLIGSPPGYVGYEEGGQLTDAVRRKPYAVILFDEMEKAHRDVLNILLQVLDDGRLTDSKGNVVNFRNTIIIFTSNVGSSAIMEAAEKEGISPEAQRAEMLQLVQEATRKEFAPEFLNRNELVVFSSLSKSNLRGIVSLEMSSLESRVHDKGFTLSVEDDVLDYLAEIGYDGVFGARPLKRVVQREVERGLAMLILKGEVGGGDDVRVYIDGTDRVKLEVRKGEEGEGEEEEGEVMKIK